MRNLSHTIMKRLFICLSLVALHFSLFMSSAAAQDALWLTGSAVPGGQQQLKAVGNGQFKYAGTLNAGELYVQTTRKAGGSTRYLTALLPDATVANHGLQYAESTDGNKSAWLVDVADDHYKVCIDTKAKTLHGEIFVPWGELFIAGGATEVGWKSEGKMLLMEQDIDNPYLWTWEGELREHPNMEEPRSFKFQGQDRWHPKSLHPYVQDADILTDQQLHTGGPDTKWTISTEGRYHIAIDLFNETVSAKIVK